MLRLTSMKTKMTLMAKAPLARVRLKRVTQMKSPKRKISTMSVLRRPAAMRDPKPHPSILMKTKKIKKTS